jgi:type II secretory pathway pseudopilin PulG
MRLTKKRLLNPQAGFTVPELLIMILIVLILSGLLLTNYQAARAKERDTHRINDINLIDSKLEAYYNAKGAYPAKFNSANLFGIGTNYLKDPKGRLIVFSAPAANATAAKQAPDPTAKSKSDYLYTAYPTGCNNAANDCTGFVLKSYIEKPTTTTPNPYIKVGISND